MCKGPVAGRSMLIRKDLKMVCGWKREAPRRLRRWGRRRWNQAEFESHIQKVAFLLLSIKVLLANYQHCHSCLLILRITLSVVQSTDYNGSEKS